MTNILQKILVAVSVIAVIYFNYLATTGAIGGTTPEVISDKYPTFLTPAGYTFTIWGLIYVGILSFAVYQFFRTEPDALNQIRALFILSCAANIAWIFAWHNEYIGLSVIAIVILLISLALINVKAFKLSDAKDSFFVKFPFSLYFGWVSVATVLNILVFTASLGYSPDYTVLTITSVILIAAVTIIGFIVREKLNIPFYSLAIAWAMTGIAVKQSGKTAVVLACAFATMAMIFSSLTFILKEHKKLK
ncbi:MAG: tryptophan-rich sensory protein [Pyrinomonadaceae bacterium]